MNAATVQSLWIGGRLSTMERLSAASFVAHGHPYHLYTYGGVEGAPPGVEVRDAAEVLPEDAVFANTKKGIGEGGFAGFSDWFRYELLSQRGGWWVDTDVVCVRPFTFDRPSVVATSREGKWGTLALGCVLRLPPGDPLLAFCLDVCRTQDIVAMVEKSYPAVGPHLLQRGIREHGLQAYEVGPDVFCPINWRHVRYLWEPPPARLVYNLKRTIKGGEKVGRITTETRGVHLWSGGWGQGGADRDATYARSSLYETLKQRYLPDG